MVVGMAAAKQKSKRTKLHITYEILNTLREKRTKTAIAYATDMNYDRLQKYLDFLIKINVIETDGKFFYITKKGLELLDALRDYIRAEKQMQNAKEKIETILSEKID